MSDRKTGGGRNNPRGKKKPESKDKKGWERYFLDGISVYQPRETAPNFVISDICINIDKISQSLSELSTDEEKIYGQICQAKDGKYYLMFNRKLDSVNDEGDNDIPY